jgi:hypothetical protein
MGAFPHGESADKLVRDKRIDVLEKALVYIKNKGVITGSAAHSILVPKTIMEQGFDVDFLMKTFHNDNYWSASPRQSQKEFAELASNSASRTEYHDNFWCNQWQEVSAYFESVKKPWIAYKVLAAGAIHPKQAFKHAFENGADFVCAGMFDFQIVENSNILRDTLGQGLNRKREWYG